MTLPRTPDILRCLVEGCSQDELSRKPSADRFSVAEALAHLHEAEINCYGRRLQQLATEADPVFQAYDTDAEVASGAYSGREALVELTHFEIARRQNLELLAGVDLNRTVRHARVGAITVGNMVAEWGCHDLGHVRQVTELIRWLRYAPELGPWSGDYRINP